MNRSFSNPLCTSNKLDVTTARNCLKTIAVLFVYAFTISFTSFAQQPRDSAAINIQLPQSKATEYPNKIFQIKPQAFGVTQAVRNLPTSVEDAAAKMAAFQTNKQKRLAARAKYLRDKGLPPEEIALEEMNRQNAKKIKRVIPGAGAGRGNFVDPLVNKFLDQGTQRTVAMPAPTLTFDGATQADNAAQGIGAVLPPDVNGDIGINHYMSSVNLVYKIFNKNGTVAAGPFKTSDLWSGLPAGDPCRVNNDGDPVVVYDPLADRWHVSQFAITGGTNCQCIAVSQTGDPTGSYYVWRYDYPGSLFNDYPKVGVWPDAYHMTFNQFNNALTAYLGMGFLSQDRPKALLGDPTTSVVYKNIAPIDPNAGGALPVDMDGIMPPPAGMAAVIAEYRADEFGDPLDAIRYYKWVPDFVNPGSSALTILPDVALAPFDAYAAFSNASRNEQAGGALLDGLTDRLMHRFAYRNLGTQSAPVNSFVGNFTVNVSGVTPVSTATFQSGIRWFEMRRTGDAFSVFDQGTHNLTPGNGGTGLNNWMASIAQDNVGNIGLGFSQSSTTQRADIKIAGRTNNVMNSGTLNEGEAVLHAATGSQTSTSFRWGDYSSMTVDPVDDCTFWYTQEYYASTSGAGWRTRIGNFSFPSCTPVPKATIQGTITLCANGSPVHLATVDATGGYNRITDATGKYSMTVAPGSYTFVAGKGVGFTSGSSPVVTVVNGQTLTVDLCLTGVPTLAATAATLLTESCLPANGVIDPGETVTVGFGVQNNGASNTVNDIGTLQASGGVTSPVAPQNYGVIAAGGPSVSRSFIFTADPGMVCGTNITATIAHVDGADNLGSLIYILPTGIPGASTTTSYAGPAVAIPDNVAAGVNIILPVSGVSGLIKDLNFRLDALAGCNAVIGNANASVTHTWVQDLVIKLTSPSGTTVLLINQRGADGNNLCSILLDDDGGFASIATLPATGGASGNFAPESPLSAFDGQNANGNWTLNISDNAAIDVGTLNRFSLIISGTDCCIPNPTIVAGSVSGNISACVGTASVSPNIQQFTISGSSLSTGILVSAPTNFEVSASPGSGYGNSFTVNQSAGQVANTTVYVRSSATAPAGPISGNVQLTSTGATQVDVAVSGTISAAPVAGISITETSGAVNNDGIICDGASAILTASGGATYLWSTGETTTSIVVSSTGTYGVTVTSSLGCISQTSATITEGTAISIVTPLCNVVLIGVGNGCTSVTAAASGGAGGYTYNWMPGNLSGATVQLCPTVTTNYTLTVTDANGCTATKIVNVKVVDISCGNKKDKKVNICHGGKTICVDQHSLAVHLAHGDQLGACGTVACATAPIVSMVGTDDFITKTNLYPNPANTGVTLEFNSNVEGNTTFEFIDLTGKILKTESRKLSKGFNQVTLNIKGLASGAHTIRMTDSEMNTRTFKYIKL